MWAVIRRSMIGWWSHDALVAVVSLSISCPTRRWQSAGADIIGRWLGSRPHCHQCFLSQWPAACIPRQVSHMTACVTHVLSHMTCLIYYPQALRDQSTVSGRSQHPVFSVHLAMGDSHSLWNRPTRWGHNVTWPSHWSADGNHGNKCHTMSHSWEALVRKISEPESTRWADQIFNVGDTSEWLRPNNAFIGGVATVGAI